MADEKLTPIRVDTPFDWHPDHVRVLYSNALTGGEGPAILSLGTAVLAQLYGTFGAIQDARKAAMAAAPSGRVNSKGQPEGNLALTPGGYQIVPEKADQLREAMTKAFDRTAPQITAAITKLQERQAKIEKVITTALESTSEKSRQLAPSIRGHINNLPAATRFTFLMAQIKKGDLVTVQSVFSGPAFLSGLTDEQYSTCRIAAAKEFRPTEHEQAEAAGKIAAHIERAGTSFTAQFAKLLPRANAKRVAVDETIAKLAAG